MGAYIRQFEDYVSGKAERTLAPNRLIRLSFLKEPKNPDAEKLEKYRATQNGRALLLATLLLSDREEVEKFAAKLDEVRKGLESAAKPGSQPYLGSAAKDSKARKFLPIFEDAVIAALS